MRSLSRQHIDEGCSTYESRPIFLLVLSELGIIIIIIIDYRASGWYTSQASHARLNDKTLHSIFGIFQKIVHMQARHIACMSPPPHLQDVYGQGADPHFEERSAGCMTPTLCTAEFSYIDQLLDTTR